MKKFFVLFFLSLFVFFGNAQSYVITHFQSEYDTLENFHSVNMEEFLDGKDPYAWEKTFDFGFDFPFFGNNYNEVTLDYESVGYFPQSPEFNIYMFSADFVIAPIFDTAQIDSEVRYDLITENNLKALVIEYHNVYVYDEFMENGPNHFVNFQIWFFENGVIELRFGEIDLANCSYYFPGQGFSFDNENPMGEIYGPWISINNNDFSQSACFFGDHSAPGILYDDDDNCGVLTSIPPEGFVVQFSPEAAVSSIQPEPSPLKNFNIIQQNDILRIQGDPNCFSSCSVLDAMGKRIAFTNKMEMELVSDTPQILFVHIEGKCGTEVHKVFVP